jgi:HAD superfamily hydrolase (TIGR01484 family)
MLPLAGLPGSVCRGLRGLLTDVDDTLTTGGQLRPDAYAALARARDAGLLVIPVTGRPAGWADLMARLWPVGGAVAENGAIYLRHVGGRMIRRGILEDDAERAATQRRLLDLAAGAIARVPGARLASDQPFREYDVAIDHAEEVGPLGPEAVATLILHLQAGGARTTVSTIHVHACPGEYDKVSMVKRLLAEQHGVDWTDPAALESFVFVGDSLNDESMFAAFPHAIGVANVRRAADRLRHLPRYVTPSASGTGFVEVVDHLLRARADCGTLRSQP